MKNYRENLVGVFGDPVDENPTGAILQSGFDELGLNFRYVTVKVEKNALEAAMAGMRAMNFTGIGITMPHKQTVLKYLDGVSDEARVMGAVNTVYRKDGKLFGENVDGKGFMMSLYDKGYEVTGKKATILGAGGAASAIAVELAFAGVSNITIVNIDEAQGMTLVNSINNNTKTVADFVLWEGAYKVSPDTDILVNATSIGFANAEDIPNVDYTTVTADMAVCDVIPNRATTRFLDTAKQKGCETFSGLEMLVNQATLCFKIWTGVEAPRETMKKTLKMEFNIVD